MKPRSPFGVLFVDCPNFQSIMKPALINTETHFYSFDLLSRFQRFFLFILNPIHSLCSIAKTQSCSRIVLSSYILVSCRFVRIRLISHGANINPEKSTWWSICYRCVGVVIFTACGTFENVRTVLLPFPRWHVPTKF